MKSTSHHQSATSLPRAPRDEIGARSARYLIMMAVRVVCFVLMVFVQPFGWYTWVFGAGAIFIPYIAVVLANVGQDSKTVNAVPPERALAAGRGRGVDASSAVVRIDETHRIGQGAQAPAGHDHGDRPSPIDGDVPEATSTTGTADTTGTTGLVDPADQSAPADPADKRDPGLTDSTT